MSSPDGAKQAEGIAPTGVPAVAVTGLVKRFGATAAVAGLSFQVVAGDNDRILGPDALARCPREPVDDAPHR